MNGRAGNNGPGRLDSIETENVIYMNVKDVKKYIYTPGAAVHNEYTVQSTVFTLSQCRDQGANIWK